MRPGARLLSAWCLILAATAFAQGPGSSGSRAPVVRDIVVEGGKTLTVDTVSYYLDLYPGDPLDMDAISEGFHRLWDSGLFEDVRIEIEDVGDNEVVLHVVVEERPFISTVEFEGNKKLNTSTLKDKLDEHGIEVPRNVPLRASQLARIQSTLKEIYDADGYRSAEVTYKVEEVGPNKRKVVFSINEGGKVKIEEIAFAGNEVFPDGKLRHQLKKTKETGLFQLFGKKTIFSEESWEEDRENLRKFYMNNGYKDVKIGQPQLAVVAEHPKAETLKAKKFRLHITVPVEEGEPYDLGTLTVSGATVFRAEAMPTIFEVKPGERYNYKAIEDGIEKVQDMYHNTGYMYAYANQVLTNREGADHVVDVTIEVFEGDQFRLGRLEFEGNTHTKDKVLRRQFMLPEGTIMNMARFKSSVFKVNALGYFKLDEGEDGPVDFDFDDENKKVNAVIKGQEVGRNDIQFGAGYSELDGFFAQTQFNTRNFLGRGSTLGLSLQLGRRADYYSLSYQDPYFLDRRILVGASIFKTSIDIPGFLRETTGASLTGGLGIGYFSSFSTQIAYEDVYSEYPISLSGGVGDPTGGHRRPVEPPPVEGGSRPSAVYVYKGTTTSITPSYSFDSRDDPFDANRGKRLSARLRLAGGPLGGTFDYVRPEVNFTLFKPLGKRVTFAVNTEVGEFFPYSGSEVPLYERYRLGGDRSLRGIPYYSVLPRTADGAYFYADNGVQLGGDRYWLGNVELQFRVGPPVKVVLFTDLGNTYVEQQGWDLALYRHTAGIEFRVFLPIFQAPIRFIYGINLDPFPDEDRTDFQFSIGSTF